METTEKMQNMSDEEERDFVQEEDGIEKSFSDRRAEISDVEGLFDDEDIPEPEELAEDTFTPVPEYVLNLFEELRATDHDHLERAKFLLVFREARWKSKGRTVYSQTRLIPPSLRAFAGFDFQIVINREEFEAASDHKKRAILDMELCRCDYKENQNTGEIAWKVNTPDLEGFIENISRYGFWTDALQNAKSAFKQKNLFDQREDIEE